MPTHFVRMLKLPEETRARYDLSSLKQRVPRRRAVPGAGQAAMIEWWGPIISEYYAGTEGNGFCAINSEEWLQQEGLGRQGR